MGNKNYLDKNKFKEFQKSFSERNRKKEEEKKKSDISEMETKIDEYSENNPNNLSIEEAERLKQKLRNQYNNNRKFKNISNLLNK